jgi:hypothetical protein
MPRRSYTRTYYGGGPGSSSAWAGWEPRVCFVCGRKVTHKHASGQSFGNPYDPNREPRSGRCPVNGQTRRGRRYLTEGRLTVERAGDGAIVASCRGDSGDMYRLGYDPGRREWRCTCPAKTRCSHLVALQLVTKRPA